MRRTAYGISELRLLPAEKRVVVATEEVDRYDSRARVMRRIRDQAIVELREDGRSYQQIADILHVTRSRAQQIVSGAYQRLAEGSDDSPYPGIVP